MNFNAQVGNDGVLLQECNDVGLLRRAISDLLRIIDDIDTAGDAFKPKRTPYAEYVMRKSATRGTMVYSDGYEIYLRQMEGKEAEDD